MIRIAYFPVWAVLLCVATPAQGAEQITVNAYGSKLGGIGPTMELWIDGSKVGTANVSATTATDYTFSAALPASGTVRLDVVFTNDAYAPPRDRNLYLNSVLVLGRTLRPTDTGVVLDRGGGRAAFDGVDTIPGQVGVYWNGATRFSIALPAASGAGCDYPIYAGGSLSIGRESGINGHDISGSGNAVDPDTGNVSGAVQIIGLLTPASFPSYSGGSNYSGSGSGLIAGTTYNSVTLTGGTVPNGDYYINTLSIAGNVAFTGGNVYVNAMTVSEEDTLSFSAATQFRIGSSVTIRKEVELRASGNPWAQFYLYGSADWWADKEIRMDGFVVAPGTGSDITVGKESRITGALITAGNISIDKEAELIYNSTVETILNGAGVCGGIPVATSTVPAGFNCVEAGADAGSGRLYTKLAGTAFSVDVVAVKTDGSVETGYVGATNKNVTLEWVDGAGSTACGSRSLLSSGLTRTVSFTAGDNGRKTVAIGPVNYAYADVRCRVTDANQTPGMVGCSTDHFAIRPSTLAVTSGANADATGLSATATPIVKTGANFSLTATSDVLGYTGTPALDISKLAAHSGAVQNGVLSGSFNSADAATGVAANSNFTYSEVGYFALGAYGVYDDSFAGVDSASGDCTSDFSNTAVGGKYGCKFGNTGQTDYFGRFIPDHLLTQVLSNGSFAHACSTFSYNGQTLNYATSNHPMLDVYAYNVSTPAAVTKNYTGGFARLQAAQFVLTAPTSDALQKGADNSTLLKLTASLAGPSLTDNGNGNLTLVLGNDSFTYQREANALIAPFGNAVGITVASVADSDGVTAGTLPMVLQPSGENIRYGRVNLMNGYGSELTDLAVPMTAEYYNGKSFVTNPDDRCSVATITVADPLPGDSLQTSDSCIWDNGGLSGSAKCGGTAPSGESYGESSGLSSGSFNLYLKAPGKTGSLTVNATVANWLMFNWQGAGAANPSATASFGLYKGNSRQIYLREVY